MRQRAGWLWTTYLVTLGTLCVMVAGCRSPAPSELPVTAVAVWPIEAFPESRLATMAARDQTLAAARLGGGSTPMALQRRTRRWAAGSTVKVAIRGGDARLHRQIADAAAQWTLHGNIGFDFGDAGGRDVRTWSPNDTRYTAQIRIGFEEPGYFSCVGDESVNAACAAPGQASMNFQGFDRELPPNWRGIVLHLFGHALGLEHERGPTNGHCDDEWRWEDDAGYTRTVDPQGRLARDRDGRSPGIYTVLGGSPHAWSRTRVDQMLRRLPESRAYEGGAPDPASVMRDDPDEWMFRAGRASRCFGRRSDRLSSQDQRAIAAMYPRVAAEVMDAVRRHQAALTSIRDAARLAPPIRRFVESRIDVLQGIRTSRGQQ